MVLGFLNRQFTKRSHMSKGERVVLTLLDKVRLGLVDAVAVVFIEGDKIKVHISCDSEQKVILLDGLDKAKNQIIREVL